MLKSTQGFSSSVHHKLSYIFHLHRIECCLIWSLLKCLPLENQVQRISFDFSTNIFNYARSIFLHSISFLPQNKHCCNTQDAIMYNSANFVGLKKVCILFNFVQVTIYTSKRNPSKRFEQIRLFSFVYYLEVSIYVFIWLKKIKQE